MKKTMLLAALMAAAAPQAIAQEIDGSQYNEYSLRPIRNADIMHKNTVWMQVDLREKINEPFFAQGQQLTAIIVQAVKDGVLRPYSDDSMQERMTLETFLENLRLPTGEAEEPLGFELEETPGWGEEWPDGGESSGDRGWGEAETAEKPAAGRDEFFPAQMSTLQMKVDLLYDRKRSRLYRDIQTVSIVIPGEYYATGIDKTIAVFSYKELVENVFRDNPAATWYNPQNLAEHRNLAEAFDLWLFEGHIIKYANPKDLYIADIYGDLKMALGQSQAYGHGLLEFEEQLEEH